MNSLHSANGVGPGKPPSRRSSYGQPLSPSSKPGPFNAPPLPEEKPPLTAASVANNHFQVELDALHGPASTLSTQTVVILNDAVYGHRFSRPRTSRNALSTIVERPERIKANVLGISAAYVRLGQRHSEGEFPIYPKRDIRALPSIPFRIHTTTRTLPLMSQAVTNVHGAKWMEELKIMCDSAEAKLAMGGKELQRPDMNRAPGEAAPERLHEGDLYLCLESRDAMEGALGAVCEAVDTVFGPGPRRAYVGVRPPGHHCSASHPSGFCWVNNVHVGINYAVLSHGMTHAAIIDFDLHHGDGSQDITWQHNARSTTATKNAAPWKKTSIGYFSLHDINSYPCEMGDPEKVKNASLCIDNAHGQTMWNVHLQSWKSEQEFWKLYETKYSVLLEKTRNYLRNQAERLRALGQVPKAAIFFSAGFDASEWESAGMQRHQVNVPTEFYARIAQDVVKLAAEEGLYVDGRVISVLEGGYSDRALCSGVFSHLSGLVGDQTTEAKSHTSSGLGFEMGQKIGAVTNEQSAVSEPPPLDSVHSYDPLWWASAELDKLESISRPPSPPRKPRKTEVPTYSSPTQASTAKVADPVKMRRSLSGLSTSGQKILARPPSPPPPEVPWVTAAHELSKLLIPSSRQTDSCTAEDLNAEASRARRDRQAILMGLPTGLPSAAATPERPASKMALRGRKAKPIVPIDEETADQLAKNRRKTAPAAELSTAKVRHHLKVSYEKSVADEASQSAQATPQKPSAGQPGRRTSRRLSGTSTILTPTDEEPPPLPSSDKVSHMAAPQVSRPTSAMSARTQSAGRLPMKKTRAATPRKEPATPRAPRSVKKAAAPRPGSRSSQRVTPARAASSTSNAPSDDMDKLTSGMKKVKINLITQSQREARERARQNAEKSSASSPDELQGPTPSQTPPLDTPTTETSSIAPTFAEKVEVSPTSLAPPEAQLPPLPAGGLSTPVQEQFTSDSVSPGPNSDLPASSPTVPYVAVQPSSDPADMFIPYQPEGPEPVAVPQQEPLKWLPSNVPSTPMANTPAATPSPVKRQDNLFKYTSGIPFAPRPQNTATKTEPTPSGSATDEVKTEMRPPPSVWDLPKSPQKQ